MSKIVVYILDRIVWLLLITIITTQSLQIAGIIDPPKTMEQISYPEQNQYDYQLAVVNNEGRGKRQTDPSEQRSQFIDSLFNIPISTLTALNNLVQHSRPAIRKLREYATQRFGGTTQSPDTAQKKVFPVLSRTKGDHPRNISKS
ncbi:uncharacterized protein LOC123683927 [Harmonia axyridis]|uniref:uncharacterized protein LOC123683927 n=1 Tax=Harmonia axyridis TaxID=115357 RepID=UPI001E27531D|nr:uncharacterized protein LOC123683927 [Harmonia axyridis]